MACGYADPAFLCFPVSDLALNAADVITAERDEHYADVITAERD